MLTRPVTGAELERLQQERADADRRYNEALTALDRALPGMPAASAAPPPPDTERLDALNQLWNVTGGFAPPPARGIRTRLARFVWSLVAPFFERQQVFNSTLVDHLNRTAARSQAATEAAQRSIDAWQAYAAALAAFHAHLIVYLQQVTLYVDTKDRGMLGWLMATYDPALNAITDELLKRWESMQAREQRFAARVQALDAAHEQSRAAMATLQESTFTLKREVERLLTGSLRAAGAGSAPGGSLQPGTIAASSLAALDSYKYVGFENLFRGSQEDIRQRLTDYIPVFAGAADVLDIGCGRGEFLDLLRQAGVSARGLDLNHEMVEVCRARGLTADEGDALAYLEALPDASLGGLFAAQVVEHLEPAYLIRLLEVAYHKLRPGSKIVLETINPACWFAFFESYIRDLTHVRPIHPDTLKYFLTASGFQRVEIQLRAPYPEHEKLQTAAATGGASPAVDRTVETMNANVERLNRLLFTYLDYAAIGVRP